MPSANHQRRASFACTACLLTVLLGDSLAAAERSGAGGGGYVETVAFAGGGGDGGGGNAGVDRARARRTVIALRPSEARALAAADLVFWTGTALEAGLARGIARLAEDARVVALKDLPGALLLGEPEVDGHMWLDPANARVLVEAAAAALGALDPASAAIYARNGQGLAARLHALDARLAQRLGPVAGRPYVVMHDAYRYFESRYRLAGLGAIAASPERPPGARRLVELRHRMAESEARCVFVEPGVEPAHARALAAGTGARIGRLDPLGPTLAPGPAAYFTLMEGLADDLTACLAPPP